MRWAVETFLERWFDVVTLDDPRAAERRCHKTAFDAVVVSEDYPSVARSAIAHAARELNPTVRVVSTFARPTASRGSSDEIRLEKPFELSELAQKLGVKSGPE